MKISHEICFCTLLSYLVVMVNLLQIKCYLFIHLERSFNAFWQFLLQKRKSFHKIIKFFIFLKNGGSTVDPKSQAVNSDWTKKLTKKDKKLIFFFRWKLTFHTFQICKWGDRGGTWGSPILYFVKSNEMKFSHFSNECGYFKG